MHGVRIGACTSVQLVDVRGMLGPDCRTNYSTANYNIAKNYLGQACHVWGVPCIFRIEIFGDIDLLTELSVAN